jgi:2-haloacid dehalogenase
MAATLAFDVYGTLIDTHGVASTLERMIGDKAQRFSSAWRDKQLEYSFRRALMQNYENFAVCTRDALEYTCAVLETPLASGQRQELLDSYRALPAFDDVPEALTDLRAAGYRLYAFSNGTAEAVETLLRHAGIREYFLGVVSCDELRSFKPNPAVYAHFLTQAGVSGETAWLVSGNSFDVLGAMSAGMRGAWVRRSPATVFDPWGTDPTATVGSLRELAATIGQ